MSDKRATRHPRAELHAPRTNNLLRQKDKPTDRRKRKVPGKSGGANQPLRRKKEMKTVAFLAAAACAATFAFSVQAAESDAKLQKDQAESTYKMAKKQASTDEKSAMAQCKSMSGDAEKQCKKDATATHNKTMADAKDAYTKAKADYKAMK